MNIEIKMDKMIDAGNVITTASRRLKESIKVGDSIEILEPENKKTFSGKIESIDKMSGHVSIMVDWASERSSV